jgi:hypothetical protein
VTESAPADQPLGVCIGNMQTFVQGNPKQLSVIYQLLFISQHTLLCSVGASTWHVADLGTLQAVRGTVMLPNFGFHHRKGRRRPTCLVIFKCHQKLRGGASQFDNMGGVALP